MRSVNATIPSTVVASPLQLLHDAYSAVYAFLDRVGDAKVARGISLFESDGKHDWKDRLRPHVGTLNVRSQVECPAFRLYGDFSGGLAHLEKHAPDVRQRPHYYGFNGFFLGHWVNRAWARAIEA